MQSEADKDFATAGNIIDFYTQQSLAGNWDSGATYNREHVWPKSLSNGLYTDIGNSDRGAGSDVLHIRPSIPNINSSRSNIPYGDLNSDSSFLKQYNGVDYAYSSGSTFEPLDNVKGDTARIILYIYTHYSSEIGTLTNSYTGVLPITNIINVNSDAEAFAMLLEWHTLDPVDALELYRNEYAETTTGSRNPYVDNQSYANMIWGDGTANTDPALVVSPTAAKLDLNETVQIRATPLNIENSTITYHSDDDSIASVSSTGLVTGLTEGTTNINVTCVHDSGTLSQVVTITVEEYIQTSYEFKQIKSVDNLVDGGTYAFGNYYNSKLYLFDFANLTDEAPAVFYSVPSQDGFALDLENENVLSNFVKGTTGWYIPMKDGLHYLSDSTGFSSPQFSTTPYEATIEFYNSNSLNLYISDYRMTYDNVHFTTDSNVKYNIYLYEVTKPGNAKVLESISYSGTPEQQVEDRLFNPDGLTFNAHYQDIAEPEVISASTITFNPSVMLLTTTSVTAYYSGKSVEITGLSILAKEDDHVVGIQYSGSPVEQMELKTFNPEGLLFSKVHSSGNTTPFTIEETATITYNPSVISLSTTEVVATFESFNTTITGLSVTDFKLLTSGRAYFITSGNYFLTLRGDVPAMRPFSSVEEIPASALFTFNGVDNQGELTNHTRNNLMSPQEFGWAQFKIDVVSAVDGTAYISDLWNPSIILSFDSVNKVLVSQDTKLNPFKFIESSKSPTNVEDEFRQYMLEENNENQCLTRFDGAKERWLMLNDVEKSKFTGGHTIDNIMAYERYLSWANHLGEDPDNEFVSLNPTTDVNSASSIGLIITISIISISSIVGYVYICKRKKETVS